MIILQKLIQYGLVLLFCICSLHPSSAFAKNEAYIDPVVNEIIKFEVKKLSAFDKLDKIVIDAGHGGKDHGCSGDHSKEKFIVLDIAKRLGALVKYYHPEIEVVYTRETDVFIPLDTRIDIANKNKADLFISIHANAIHKEYVGGTETYVMGLHRAEENLAVAKRENSAILMENNYEKTYGGYDPTSPEAHILLSMYQNAYLDKSINFATKIENSFTSRTPLKSRGVKQAGFLVLRKATMPSVLIETGFLTNDLDEAYLMSEQGKDESADAILKAITQYKREVEGEYWISQQDESETVSSAAANKLSTDQAITYAEPTPSAQSQSAQSTAATYQGPDGQVSRSPIQQAKASMEQHLNPADRTTAQRVTKTSANTSVTVESETDQKTKRPSHTSSTSSLRSTNRTYSGATGIADASHAVLMEQQQPAVSHSSKSSTSKVAQSTSQHQPSSRVLVNTSTQKVYRIQIAAGKQKLITGHESKFKAIADLEVRKENDMFKYMTGYYTDLAEAFRAKDSMRQQGFRGAFIVAYEGDSRVSL